MADDMNHDGLITDFCGLTGASPSDAEQFLTANRWDMASAATEYYTSQEEGTQGAQSDAEDAQETEPYTGPRTLDGRPAPQSIPTVASTTPLLRRGGVATLDSLAQTPAGHGHAHDDDDDDDDDDFEPGEKPRDLFAGGEKSALAVQDPARNDARSIVNDILSQARANAARGGEGGVEPSATPSRFHGSGQTLGDDDTPSQTIPTANPRAAPAPVAQSRVLHLWEDGFSLEDGELRRFDDQQNAADLAMIRSGRAPLHLMNVRPDQPVDVQLVKHHEPYKTPPKVYKPFSGGGQRLGSPTPGGSTVTTTPAPAAAAAAAPATSTTPEVDVDSSQPTLTLRIQLADGTRLPARFNTTQTIGDVYQFVSRASPGSDARSWVLATTFPNKDHTDRSLVLGEMAEFKRGGNAVQKWT